MLILDACNYHILCKGNAFFQFHVFFYTFSSFEKREERVGGLTKGPFKNDVNAKMRFLNPPTPSPLTPHHLSLF